MESRLQRKLRERREAAVLAELGRQLSGLLTGRGMAQEEAPPWIGETVSGFWDVFVEPYGTLPDDVEPAAVDAWIERLLTRHGVTGRVYVRSPLTGLHWLECRVPDGGWVSRVRQAVEDPWVFVSGDLDVVVAVLEGEYYYQAHVGRKLPGAG
ncbi:MULTISPECIES: hypothetical protein [Kitasatospora]|uniref:hypothetical protein n=1 Tax=Kitasatospora TaxID=2063 RepID=UPI0031E38080